MTVVKGCCEEIMQTLKNKGFYIYSDEIKQRKPRKSCIKEKCKKWRGVDCEGLVWCNEYSGGLCWSLWDNEGRPYDSMFLCFEDVSTLLTQALAEKKLEEMIEGSAEAVYQQWKKQCKKCEDSAKRKVWLEAKELSLRKLLKNRPHNPSAQWKFEEWFEEFEKVFAEDFATKETSK